MATTDFTQAVVTTLINGGDNLVGFQGDFTFDSTVVTFQATPVGGAGLTGTNWNVSANVLPGGGPIRILRVSAFSNDFTPLSGSGTLFNLNMTRVSSSAGASTALTWDVDPNNFYFIDANLESRPPNSTPGGSISIQGITVSGAITYCSNPSLNPVPSVTMSLTGSSSGSTLTDGSGNYTFTSLIPGGNYTITPSKASLPAGSIGVDTVDVIATQRHFLGVGAPLSGCRLTAADVNSVGGVDTVDVIAIQRFFLGLSTGIANAGKYQFNPTNRTYASIGSNQTGQNYSALIFGDVASGFVHRPGTPGGDEPNNEPDANEVPATVESVALPDITADQSRNNFVAPVTTSEIDAKNKLVGFQGDFTFDERVVGFEDQPVQKAGLTAGNWNVSGNLLDGSGPMRTLRVSAFSTDFAPLSGSGTLFELRMTKMSGVATHGTPFIWAPPPDNFIFIDADLNRQKPVRAASGSIITSARDK
jgi:hypothetical protein